MACYKDWDETQPKIHWHLKKCFIEAHHDKYPEDQLSCYANLFHNIEFLDAKYNPELMNQVNSLADEVEEIHQYRLQKIQKRNETRFHGPSRKKMRYESNIREIISETDKVLLRKAKDQPGWRSKLILFEFVNNPSSLFTLSNSLNRANLTIRTESTEDNNEMTQHQVTIENEVIVEKNTSNENPPKTVKKELFDEVLNVVKDYCFTVLVGDQFEGANIDKPTVEKEQNESETMMQNSIGAKMMKMMGWSGQGLGKNETGREKPVEVTEYVNRQGIGLGSANKNIRRTVQQYFERYVKEMDHRALIFSKDFTNEERKIIHELARKFNLKSKSYGKNEERQLIVSRKLSAWEIVEDLLAAGGKSNQYTLVRPRKL